MLHPISRFLDHVEELKFLKYYGNKDTIKMYLQLLFKWHGLLRIETSSIPHFLCIVSFPLKGQLISKGIFGILNPPKKWMKKFNFTTIVPQIESFSFIFWENWIQQKDISKLTDL